MKRTLRFDPARGFPAGRDIHYECEICGVTVPSMPGPSDPGQCKCKNIQIDPDAGRVSVRDPKKLRAFYTEPQYAILSRTEFEAALDEARAGVDLLVAGGAAEDQDESGATVRAVVSELEALVAATAGGRTPPPDAPALNLTMQDHLRRWPAGTDPVLLACISAIAEYALIRMRGSA